MKKLFKVVAIIALIAAVGFSIAACDDGSTDDSGGGGSSSSSTGTLRVYSPKDYLISTVYITTSTGKKYLSDTTNISANRSRTYASVPVGKYTVQATIRGTN
ncbi:MAG: hypothetical protein LBU82_00545, partial [Treponema sp.]|nr:hypothetical protein [Treponema sp.]